MAEEDMVSFYYSYRWARGRLEFERGDSPQRDAESAEISAEKTLGEKTVIRVNGEKVNVTESAEEAEETAGARLLPGGELSFQRADEFLKRLAVRGLPLDEDEEAAAVEEDRAGNRPPALHHVQSHGGRGQLIDTRVELAGAFVRRRADAFRW